MLSVALVTQLFGNRFLNEDRSSIESGIDDFGFLLLIIGAAMGISQLLRSTTQLSPNQRIAEFCLLGLLVPAVNLLFSILPIGQWLVSAFVTPMRILGYGKREAMRALELFEINFGMYRVPSQKRSPSSRCDWLPIHRRALGEAACRAGDLRSYGPRARSQQSQPKRHVVVLRAVRSGVRPLPTRRNGAA